MLKEYIPILMLMGFAAAFAVINIFVSKIFGPKNPNPQKLSTYESGMEPVGTARMKFSVKYYMVAVLFIIFDIEIVFMYPWAVTFLGFKQDFIIYALIEMIVFITLLLIPYFYLIRKGVLRWE